MAHHPFRLNHSAGQKRSAGSVICGVLAASALLAWAASAQARETALDQALDNPPQETVVSGIEGEWSPGAESAPVGMGMGMRSRIWLSGGPVAIGWGLDGRAVQPWAPPGTDLRPLLALRVTMSQNTRLYYERPSDDSGNGWTTDGERRVGLEIGSAMRSPKFGAGILRIQVSQFSTLQLRPRGGGFSAAWRTKF